MHRDTIPLRSTLRRTLLIAGMALAAWTVPARAQSSRPPARLLVGYAAGGGVDAMARLLAAHLPGVLGQPVEVENRAGAAGAVAAEAVARAPADGDTLLVGETALLIARSLGLRLAVDPLRSFAPVAGVFQLPLMLVASNAVQVTTPRDFIALLKAHPGRYSYASAGVGTAHHLGMEILKARTGTYLLHIPYRGASQIISDVISGQVPFGVVSAAAGLPQARAGRLKAVAMLSVGRLPGAESVPAMAEVLPGFDVSPRVFVLAPAGTPSAVVGRLSVALRTVLASPALEQSAEQHGATPDYRPAAVLAADMAAQIAQWQRVIRQQKLVVE